MLFAPCLLSVALLGPQAGASADYRNVDGPIRRIRYDVATGKVTRLGRLSSKLDPIGVGTTEVLALCFDNSLTSGYSTNLTNGWEFVEFASKACPGSGLIDRFEFGYATTARDVNDVPPGPGASLGLRFYQGGSALCAAAGTLVGVYDFTGLPGATGTTQNPGFYVTASLPAGQPLLLANGPISYGYTANDGPAGTPARSGPLLTEFSANTGWADLFDAYNRSPASQGTCTASFFFGGCSPPVPPPTTGTPCAGFYLRLFERDVPPASAIPRVCGINPNVFVHVGSDRDGDCLPDLPDPGGPVLGESWLSSTALLPSELATIVFFGGVNLPMVPTTACGGMSICMTGIVHRAVSLTGSFCISIPFDLSLAGRELYTQNVAIDAPPLLLFPFKCKNAIDITIGLP